MTRLYIPEPLPGRFVALWLTPLPLDMTYQAAFPPNFFETEVERVGAEQAEAIVVPNNFRGALNPEEQAYVKKYADLGERLGKPVIVFALGDFTDDAVFDPRVYVLRFSLYKHQRHERDILIPNIIEDLGTSGISLRVQNKRPLVSFCGLAGFDTALKRFKYHLKNLRFELRSLADSAWRAHKTGIYWRRASMHACKRSTLVDTHFIVRTAFSGNRKTINLDSGEARTEFIESIVDSDFVLASKGDGNYSNRFLEALSLGRIPVVIDTDIVLPLENVIDYSKITVRVPMDQVGKTPQLIRAFYDALSEEEWHERQQLARDTFEKYLRHDTFFRYFFETMLPTLH